MKSYVIDKTKGWCAHEGDRASCEAYVRNGFQPSSDYVIADGAKGRDAAIKALKA